MRLLVLISYLVAVDDLVVAARLIWLCVDEDTVGVAQTVLLLC